MHKYLPQIVYLMLVTLGLGVSLVKHGLPKTGKNNVFVDVLSSAILTLILMWGGFFSTLR